MKKVFATIIAIIVFIMVIVSFINLFKKDEKDVVIMQVPVKYFTILENEKYGVIDGKGNVIIKPQYDEMIIIPNSSKPVFVCIDSVDYSNSEYKTKVLNEKKQEILKSYSKISPIENSNNNAIWYEDNILKYEENGKYGLIDFSGKKILPAEYSNIYALDGIQKSVVVEKDGLKGIVNSSLGTLVVECKYKDIQAIDENTADNGYIVNLDEKWGVVSGTGKEILACNYQEVKKVFGNDMYVVKDDSGLKIINNSLNVIKDSGFDNIIEINGDYITLEVNGKKGVINSAGLELIPVQYDDLKFSCDNYFIAKKDDKYGIISAENVVLVDFSYTSISFVNNANFYTAENEDFTTNILSRKLEVKLSNIIISDLNIDDAYLRVRKSGEYKYYNFNFEEKKNIEILKNNTLFLVKKDGKYGYVNKNNELIVNYIYDDAREQNEFGYCVVKQNGKWGVLAQDGTVIVKPSVDLDSNLYIDFISKWHLYSDADVNIYVK